MIRLAHLEELRHARTVEQLRMALVAIAHDLDFGIITAALVKERLGAEPQIATAANAPTGYLALAHDPADTRRDPVLSRLRRESVPFCYDQELYVSNGAGDLWEKQAPFGFKVGVAVALHLPGNQHFLLGVDREAALPTDELELTRLFADVQLLAAHAQVSASRVFAPPHTTKPVLTDRELQVLELARASKSAWVIAQLLSISERTVKAHLERIYSKLEVTSKGQAILKAIDLDLI